MFRRVTSVIAVAAVAVLAAFVPVGASATILVDVSASPETIAVGQTSTLTATDLGNIGSVVFDVGSTPGGTLTAGGASGTSIEVGASGGSAQAEFTSTEPGTFEVVVSEGSMTLAVTTVVVTEPLATGPDAATLTAAPDRIDVGDRAMLTAEGLGELTEASFGLDGTPGGALSREGGTGTATVLAPVTDGSATVEFTATEAGVFTIAVGDGETVLAMTTVTVDEAATAPSPSPSESEVASDSEGDATALPWIIAGVVGALIVIGAVIAFVLVRRRKKADRP